jgi:NADP-dependent 3-hydroxy acid dehydrogenase YdfG
MTTEQVLAGQTAVVTGASSGIGRAIAETLGEAGAHVVLAGRTAGAMQESVTRIEKAGGRAESHVVDVRDVAPLRGLVEDALSSTGRLDVMVNNAGLSHPGAIVDADPDHWRTMLETNVLRSSSGARRPCAPCAPAGRVGTSSTSRRWPRFNPLRACTARPSTP